ncbi:MAG: glycosyltransferase family 4 protein [Desulfovibrionaceae bacterium]|nr:glycosyltransferase family 4 protein [Desulfovibrionaceae bacterium]
MKIAVLGLRSIGNNCSGGIERHVQELSVRMAAEGHEVTVFCRGKYNDAGEEYKGVRLVNRTAIYSKHLEAVTHTAIAVPSTLVGYDVVHFHATGPSLLSWIPRLAMTPTIVTVHGLDYLRAKWGKAARAILRAGAWTSAFCPSRTIVVSKVLREHYKKTYGRDTAHVPNGIEAPTLRTLDGLKRFGIDKGEYVLSLGRLVPEKGIHYLVEAFRGVDTSVKLVIVGGDSLSGGYLQELKVIAGDDPRIVFTGPLYGADKDEAFSNARMFAIPSDLEGMPIAMLEAMSYGCPTLSSDIPECMEVFDGREGEVGFSFTQGNIESLKAQLEMMLGLNLSPIGAAGRDYVLDNYNWDAITEQTLSVYREACK